MSPGLRVVEVEINVSRLGISSTGPAPANILCVPWLGSGKGANESFHKGEIAMNGIRRETRKGSRTTLRFLS